MWRVCTAIPCRPQVEWRPRRPGCEQSADCVYSRLPRPNSAFRADLPKFDRPRSPYSAFRGLAGISIPPEFARFGHPGGRGGPSPEGPPAGSGRLPAVALTARSPGRHAPAMAAAPPSAAAIWHAANNADRDAGPARTRLAGLGVLPPWQPLPPAVRFLAALELAARDHIRELDALIDNQISATTEPTTPRER